MAFFKNVGQKVEQGLEAKAGMNLTRVNTPNYTNFVSDDGQRVARAERGKGVGETLVKRVLPVAGIGALGMMALPALAGAGGAGAAGTAASTAGGLGAAGGIGGGLGAAGGIGGALGKIPMVGGALSKGYDMLGGLDGALALGAGIEGYEQDRQANRLRGNALDLLGQEFTANAPLRQAGRAGMLNPETPDLSSVFASSGNPFAAPMPMPSAPRPTRRVP
jgi:hypothetical protein